MQSVTQQIEAKYKKHAVIDVKSGDTVRVHQKIVEGGKERVQIFEGLVIRTDRQKSLTSSFTVRRIASGIGVEKTYLIHSPNVIKVEVTKRSKVRRNYLSYMRKLTGKSARLSGVEFDKRSVNDLPEEKVDTKVDTTDKEIVTPEINSQTVEKVETDTQKEHIVDKTDLAKDELETKVIESAEDKPAK